MNVLAAIFAWFTFAVCVNVSSEPVSSVARPDLESILCCAPVHLPDLRSGGSIPVSYSIWADQAVEPGRPRRCQRV